MRKMIQDKLQVYRLNGSNIVQLLLFPISGAYLRLTREHSSDEKKNEAPSPHRVSISCLRINYVCVRKNAFVAEQLNGRENIFA